MRITRVWPIVVTIVAAGFVLGGCTPTEIEAKQKTPEGAFRVFVETCEAFRVMRASLWDVFECVRESDAEWFKENYQSLQGGSGGILSLVGLDTASDPTVAKAIRKREAMLSLVSRVPHHPDNEIVESEAAGELTTFTIKMNVGEPRNPYYVYLKIDMIKEGKYWKVADFGGARSGNIRRVDYDDDDDAAGAGSAAAAAPGSPVPQVSSAMSSLMPNPPGQAPGAARPASPAAASGDGPRTVSLATPAPGSTRERPPAGAAPEAVEPAQAAAPQSPAQFLLDQAGADWQAGKYRASMANARRALDLFKRELGEDHPKVIEVQNMLDSGEKTIAEQELK